MWRANASQARTSADFDERAEGAGEVTEQQKAWLSEHPGDSPIQVDGDMTKGWDRQGLLLPTGEFVEISSQVRQQT